MSGSRCGRRLFAALVDEAVDDGVEAGAGAAELRDAGDGEVEEGFDAREGDDEVVEAHDGVDFVVDGADVGGDFGVEEGAGDDLEREGHLAAAMSMVWPGCHWSRWWAAMETMRSA